MFAFELEEGVTADLVALAKGLSGGILPIAATLTTEEIYRAYLGPLESQKTFFHGHTYTGNPLASLAGITNLELIEESGLLRELPAKISALEKILDRHRDHPHVGEIRQLGLMVGIELVKDRSTREVWEVREKVPQRIVESARRRGAVIRPLGNVMVLMPAPAMPLSILEELVEITFSAITEVTESLS
jgi:adenosylmethionine-8-amino-7-oxononanoate aminotransferase